MSKYKDGRRSYEDAFNEDPYKHQLYGARYYDNPDYYHAPPDLGLRYPAMGRRGYDLTSSDLDRPDRKRGTANKNSRIAIIVAIVLVACAIIAGIVVAVYFTSIPAPQTKPKEITEVNVSRVKAFQGEVSLAKDWNVGLSDSNSTLYKDQAKNFTSAMDAIYENNPQYNGTVVQGFRNGSIVVEYKIYFIVIVTQTVNTSAKSNNGQQGQVVNEVETNTVDTAKIMKLLQDNLPKELRINVTRTSTLEEVTTTTAAPTTTMQAFTNGTTATTEKPATTTITISTTLQPTTSTTQNPTTTTITTTKEPTIITSATATTPVPTTTTTTTKEPTTTTTTLPSTLPPTIASTTTTTAPNPSTTTTSSATPELIITTRPTSTTPEQATTTTSTTKEPTTTTTTIPSTLPSTITTSTTTTTPKPSTTTTTYTSPELIITTRPTSTTPEQATTTTSTTKEPTTTTTTIPSTLPLTFTTSTTTTTPKPSTTTTTYTSPELIITTRPTSTTPEQATTTTSTTKEPTDTTTTIPSTLPSTITTSTTTTTPKPSSTTTTSTTPELIITTRPTSTTPEHTTTTTTASKEPTTSSTTVPTTLPSTIITATTTTTPKPSSATTATTPQSTTLLTTSKLTTATTLNPTTTSTVLTTSKSTTNGTSVKPTTTSTTTISEPTTFTTHGPMTTPNPCQISGKRELSVSLAFKGLVWHDQLKNSSSQMFQNYSTMVTEAIYDAVSQIPERDAICNIEVIMMMNGSTRVIGKVVVLASSYISAVGVQEFFRNVSNEQLARMQLDAANVKAEEIPPGCDVVQQAECYAMGFTHSQTSFVAQFSSNLTNALSSYLTDSCTQEMITFALCDSYYPKCGPSGSSGLLPICHQNCLEIQKFCPTLFQLVRANPCLGGDEECVQMYPAYSLECDFNEDMCGYQNYIHSTVQWRREPTPFNMGGYFLFDRGPLPGSDGSATPTTVQTYVTMPPEGTRTQTAGTPWRYSTTNLNTMGSTTSTMSNGYILVVNALSTYDQNYLYSPNFTSAGYNCYLHFSVALAVGSGGNLDTQLDLYNSFGYARTLVSQYYNGSLWTGWIDQTFYISPGDFYLMFYVSGSNFQAALDNVYLSGCSGSTNTPYPTPFPSPVVTTTPSATLPVKYDLEIRLSNQTYKYGRVEIRRRNSSDEWGTICDDMWDDLDAKVVCRNLGYSEDIEAYSYRGAFFGQGYGPIWINRVDCSGNEQFLSNCMSQQWGNIHCTHMQDAGVSCGQYIPTTPRPSTPIYPTLWPNYTTVTTPSPPGGLTVRLVNGPSCIVGRVEIWYQGQWGTVCDDNWSNDDAEVICRMLGYSTFGAIAYGSATYGQGTGPILLDEVMCNGWESSIADCSHNPWGQHDCSHSEDAAVRCGGTEDQCFAQNTVDCDFDRSSCGYTTAAVSGSEVWRIQYVQGIPPLPSTSSPNYSIEGNRVAYYININGTETDEAYLKSPDFTMNTSTNILEFYYLMNASTLGALRLEGKEMELWESPVLRSEEENKWMYQCASLDQLMPDIEQTVSFYAKKGPINFRVIAVDKIELSEGTCQYGLEDATCDFERPSVHGYTINCTYCKTQIPKFRWYWGNGFTPSEETGPDVDHTYGNNKGHYMYAEASYGEEGDATALTFPIVSTKMTFRALQFYYNMYGRDTGSLRLMLEYSGQKKVVWEKTGNNGNLWRKDCTLLPLNSNVTISFVAVKGPGPYGDIAVDDIELLTENCPHPITCMEDFQQCGYTRSSESEEYMWNWSGDIRGDSFGCNFEANDCSFNSSTWQHVESSRITQLGNIIHDPVYGERGHYMYIAPTAYWYSSYLYSPWFMTETGSSCQLSFMYKCNLNSSYMDFYVSLSGKKLGQYGTVFYRSHYSSIDWTTVSINISIADETQLTFAVYGGRFEIALDEIDSNCGGLGADVEGQMAVLRSPAFQNKQEAQYLIFYHQIPTTDTIKVTFQNHDDGTGTVLSSLSSITDSLELVCINLPRVVANTSISFEAIRGDNSIKSSYSTAVRNIEIKDGLCPDTLDKHNCTFESEDALCGRNITSSVATSCDLPVYMWVRHSGTTWTAGTGPDFDHTFNIDEINQSVTYGNQTGKGHYMYADASVGSLGDTTTLTLKDFLIGKFCSLRFFYHMYGNSTPVLHVRETRGAVETVLPSLNLNAWIPSCLKLKNDCTVQESTVRSVSFVAERGNGPWGDIAIDDISLSIEKCPYTSINCTFMDGMCGYVAEYGWELNKTADGGYLAVRSGEAGKLVSPSVRGPGCITLYYTATTEYIYAFLSVINLTIGNEVYPILMDGQTRMLIVPISTTELYSLVMLLSSTFYGGAFYLHNVTFSSECPMLECKDSDFACKNYCISAANTCDGHTWDCSDGSDEADYLCPPSIECDFNKMYACNYTFTNAYLTASKYNITSGVLDNSVQLYHLLSFVESPVGVFDSMSCLQYKYTQYGEGRHRLVSNTSDFLKNLYIFDGLKAQGIPVTLQASLTSGNYSIIFEFQTNNMTGSYAQIDDVEILAGRCLNYSVSCNLNEEFLCHNIMWNGDILDICLPNADKCNHRVDCSDGSDEMGCSYSLECDFNEHMCGYQNYLLSSVKWRREATPITMGGYTLFDRGPLPGFGGSTTPTPASSYGSLPPEGTVTQATGTPWIYSTTWPDTVNYTTSTMPTGYILVVNVSLTHASTYLYSPNFTSAGYNCYLHFSAALAVGSGGSLYTQLDLYSSYDYARTLISQYYSGSLWTGWIDQAFYISPGDFYLIFYVGGSNFQAALDNVYLSGCNGQGLTTISQPYLTTTSRATSGGFAPYITYIDARSNGTHANITCIASGYPNPNIAYYISYGSRFVDGNIMGHTIVGNSMIVNYNYTWSSYYCKASNAFGYNDYYFSKPGIPSLWTSDITSTSVMIHVIPPPSGNLPLISYIIQHFFNSEWRIAAIFLADITSYNVTGLTPNSTNNFVVAASNALGYGNYSNQLVVTLGNSTWTTRMPATTVSPGHTTIPTTMSTTRVTGDSCEMQGSLSCFSGNQCYYGFQRCDGYFNCRDQSDEWDCHTTIPTTMSTPTVTGDSCEMLGSLSCFSGNQCYYGFQRCDGYFNCRDQSDEWDCHTTITTTMSTPTVPGDSCEMLGSISCFSGNQCYYGFQRCNGYFDCRDQSDEWDCHTTITTTMSTTRVPGDSCEMLGSISCFSGNQCYYGFQRCNGYFNCIDQSDEWDCHTTITTTMSTTRGDSCEMLGSLSCFSGNQCYYGFQRCNGYFNCIDQSDEWDCNSTWTTTVSPTVSADGCYSNPVFTCFQYGFEHVIMPSVTGHTSVTEAGNQLMFSINNIWSLLANIPSASTCINPLLTFLCGSYMSDCVMGEQRLLCRESCEAIAKSCVNKNTYDIGAVSNIEYFCKFLPYQVDDQSCLPINISAVEANSTVPDNDSTPVIKEVRLVNGNSEYSGRLEVLVNGTWGTVCDSRYSNDFFSAAAFCFELGFSYNGQWIYGSYYGYGPRTLINSIYCPPGGRDLDNCTIQFDSYCPYSYYSNMGLVCVPTSATCNFHVSDCGYYGDSWYRTLSEENMYLMTTNAQEGEVTELMSPRFTAKSLNSVTFTYKISKWISGKYMLSVDNGRNRTALWQLDGRELEGVFKDCVEVQGFRDVKIQLVFLVMIGQPLETTRSTAQGVLDVTINSGSCPGVFPAVACTFESSTACQFVATCNNKNSYKFQMKSGPRDSFYTGPQMNFTSQNNTGHYMIADASYGEEGDSADFKISVTVEPHRYYLRYQYYMSGPNVGSLRVHINGKNGPTSILISEHHGDQGESWNPACWTIPSTNLSMFYIVFNASRGNGTQGDIAIDDIEYNTKPCPHPVSCDFERPNYCDYNFSQTAYHWQGDYLWQQNGTQLASGNFIRTDPYNGSEGDVAEVHTPNFNLGADTKCVSFAFIMSGEDVGSLNVYVVYDNDVAHRKLGFSAAGNQGTNWYKANAIIEYANLTYKTAAIVFSAEKGDGTDSYIGLDNVIISSEECVYGIQNNVCGFDNPYLCGIQSNCSDGSQYQWQIYKGASMTNGTGASSDANEDFDGSYLTIDSSYGGLGDVSFAWFPPIHTSSATKLIFDYHMYGRNEDFNNLTLLFGTQSGLTTLDKLCCNRWNVWIFKCLPLPNNTQGTVYFKATRKNGVFGDISLDNVGLIEGNCPTQSVVCDFDKDDFNCGYRGWERTLQDTNYFMGATNSNGTSILMAPFAAYDGPACIGFDYRVSLNDFSWSGSGLLLNVSFEITSGEYSDNLFDVSEDTGDNWVSGQVQIPDLNNAVGFRIIFAAYGRGYFAVDKVTLKGGQCSLPTCATDEFACIEKCIPKALECDKKSNCANGRDERVSCTPSMACDFEMAYHCGYQNTSYNSFNTGWEWVQNLTSRIWNATWNIVDEMNKNGYFLVASPLGYYDIVTVQSPTEKLAENKCLRFSFFGNGLLNVYINGITASIWSDVANDEQFSWQSGQLNLPVGDISVRFSAFRNQMSIVDSIIGIDNLELLNGSCASHVISCSEFSIRCLDNSKCIDLQQLCNRISDCPDGSDESEDYCPITLACQFEDDYLCGYRNLQNDSTWYQRSGNFFKLPQYDHTYGNETGQFMVAYNTSDLGIYYNLLSYYGPGYPHRLEYSNSTLISPSENFTTESCVYFYYYLNGTAVRPNPLSAQLFVYVNSSRGRRLAWYDHINRTVNGWLKGWVSVYPGHAEVIFVAKTITTTTVWPGVVALDDVSVISRPCPAYPACGHDTFRCTTSRICIPVYMQCDGGNDCLDGSDEENCISKPNYQLELINGDGSYGSIAIFYQGLWRPVCMSLYSLTAGSDKTVQLACKKVGYTGRYQGAFVNSWQQPVQYAMQVSCGSYTQDILNCSMYLTQTSSSCYYYQAAFCSNDECFSGERVCPPDHTYSNYSSSTKCISYQYFCDGIPDCPGGTDELNCANCSTSEFECTSHQCIPAPQQCDGTPQCGDNSDEYGCVIVASNRSQIYHYHLSAYLPVCYNNMNSNLANVLCSLSGQGSSSHYQQYTFVRNGTVLTPQSNATILSLVPGYAASVEPCYSVLLQCASIECGSTIFDDSRLPKILFGRDAVLGQLPWQIALYANGEFMCGGSIIHPNWVLTAAHCTEYLKSYSVIVGAVEVGRYSSISYQGKLYNSSRTYNNPLYNRVFDNDNSLLYLSQPIAFNNYVRPICIASKRTVDEMLKASYNTECYVSGWGNIHGYVNRETWEGSLQMVRVHLYNKEECNQIYYDVYRSYPQNTTVCVDNQNLGSPTCFGDSGGSLICRNKYGRFEMLGTLSWGYESCFKDGYPDIYQLSYPHASWLELTTGLNFSDLTMDIE